MLWASAHSCLLSKVKCLNFQNLCEPSALCPESTKKSAPLNKPPSSRTINLFSWDCSFRYWIIFSSGCWNLLWILKNGLNGLLCSPTSFLKSCSGQLLSPSGSYHHLIGLWVKGVYKCFFCWHPLIIAKNLFLCARLKNNIAWSFDYTWISW